MPNRPSLAILAAVAAFIFIDPSPAQAQLISPIPGKQPPTVTRQMGELTGEFVQSRRLWLSGLHARLSAMLAREGLRAERPITQREVETRRLRQIVARDTSGFQVTLNITRDPDETDQQLVATCYVSIAGEYHGTRVQRGSESWARLVRMVDFLARSEPHDPDH